MSKKKITTVSIDEDILRLAKREIPNLSEFMETCLKTYFGVGSNNDFVINIQEELNKIKEAQLKIHLLSENDFNDTVVQEFDSKKMNKAWLDIWASYRTHEVYYHANLETASKVLGYTAEQIHEIMETLKTYCSKNDLIKCDDWNIAIKTYEVIINGED